MKNEDFLNSFKLGNDVFYYYDLAKPVSLGLDVGKLPYSIRILAENLLRKMDGRVVSEDAFRAVANWKGTYDEPVDIPFHPARVLMQDFTGVPAIVDLAAMRDAVRDRGRDPLLVNPMVPVDLVVDHSVQVDFFGSDQALKKNVELEYQRNRERYALLKWAQKNFRNFNIVPPNSGICHQVNLEYLSRVVMVEERDNRKFAFPDTLLGTDSHTPMINGIGVMGWGVGGIEAEAVILGEPYYMSIPEVIGVRLSGKLKEGVTATDLVLTLTQLLREHKVVEKFVEYFGPGMKQLNLADRATISNMTPEHGATLGLFPIDEKTLEYMKNTNREKQAELVEAYARANGLFYTGEKDPQYTEVLEFDLAAVTPSLAGPSRPQDRVPLPRMKQAILSLTGPSAGVKKEVTIDMNGQPVTLADGSVVIAAITSCTNTSNPYVMLGAGLVAQKAAARGLRVPPQVKTSLAPGSKVVRDYLACAGLLPYLEQLGFHVVGYGCTTCIGNSGPLHPAIEKAIRDHQLTAAAVLSGNRNFEARIHSRVRANFLASPMLVVAFALAGRADLDMETEPLAIDPRGEPVFLRDIWPTNEEIDALVRDNIKKEFFEKQYAVITEGDEYWQALPIAGTATFQWQADSTYIRKPPFFEKPVSPDPQKDGIFGARALLVLGDSITTDHISPAGSIPADYPAGRYLQDHGTEPRDFNSYGSRRGNHEVMMRGTFANVRIKNRLVTPQEGGLTVHFPDREEMSIFDAAAAYGTRGTPLIVLGGKEYGTGSSRDWAAKGTMLLGIRAVIAESFERIHRNNLVGMGVLPLVFANGQSIATLGLDGSEFYDIPITGPLVPRQKLKVKAITQEGKEIEFGVLARVDNRVELAYYRYGGILPYVLHQILDDA